MTKHIKFVSSTLLLVFALISGSALADRKTGNTNADGDINNDGVQVVQTVPYISLRNLTGEAEPDEQYGDERDTRRAGRCVLKHESWGLPKSLSDNGLVYIPEANIKLEAVEVSEINLFWRDLAEKSQGQRPLLYLHGYNTSFAKACKQASLFQEKLSLQNRLVLFSWPSDGSFLNYARDEADIYWSVAPLEATLLEMVEQFGAGGIDIVAHSIGARALFLAMVQIAHGFDGDTPLFNQVVLTAPDVDAGVFKQYLPDIRALARNISLYASDNDKPLAISREVHGYPRLGEAGPHLDDIEGIEIIDVSGIGVRSFSGHLYHLYHANVGHDMDLLLNHGVRAGSRIGLEPQGVNTWRLSMP